MPDKMVSSIFFDGRTLPGIASCICLNCMEKLEVMLVSLNLSNISRYSLLATSIAFSYDCITASCGTSPSNFLFSLVNSLAIEPTLFFERSRATSICSFCVNRSCLAESGLEIYLSEASAIAWLSLFLTESILRWYVSSKLLLT